MKDPRKWLLGDSIKRRSRMEKLYGPGNYDQFLEKEQKKTIALYMLTGLILILVVLEQLIGGDAVENRLLMDENGYISQVARPGPGQSPLVVEAIPTTVSGDRLIDNNVSLVIQPQNKEGNAITGTKQQQAQESGTEAKTHEIRKAVYKINSDVSDANVSLPMKLDDGTPIRWKQKKQSNSGVSCILIVFSWVLIYRSKDAGLKKKEKEARDTIILELPEFVNKLVLLLNAGLVLTNAFGKIVVDHQKTRGGDNNYFYNQLENIFMNFKDNNYSLQQGIRDFAVRSGVVEFMRLSNIIGDSLTKGSDLMTQLKMEGDTLWIARRKQTEEKGKIAETKLTFPLVILLLVLVMITIAPAMMEM